MKSMFQGDNCQVNEAGISSAGNPMSRAMDGLSGDPMHARQMREGFMQGMRPGGPQMMDPMMGQPGSSMDQAWGGPMPMGGMPEQLRQHMQRPPGADMREAGFYKDGPMMAEANWAQEFGARPMGPMGPGPQMQMNRGPDWAQEFGPQGHAAGMEAAFQQANGFKGPAEMHMQMGPMMGGPMGMMGGMMGGMMRPPMMSAPMMAPAQPMQPRQEAASSSTAEKEQEAFQEALDAKTDEQADLGQAAQMVEMLRNSGNPKFANSQFVSFIDKVSKGDLQFKENTVIDRTGKEVDWDSLYDMDAAMAAEQAKSMVPPSSEFNKIWGDVEAAGAHASEAELEALFRQAREEEGDMSDMWNMSDDALQQAWGMPNAEEAWSSAAGRAEYKFQEGNQFMDAENPLAEALRLLKEGRDREALLALEAEVQKNPESSEGWRIMGQLYAELDQDVEAIQCLRKGHEVDPYNLDSLLALGVSCTNELDQLLALRYLRRWIENHEDHQVLVQGLETPEAYDYEGWRQQVTMLYNKAAAANPLDSSVFIALGVMENINRNFDSAVRSFATACRLRPNDHTVWNKLGATLANSGKSEQAVVAYHQGLLLKPNYARSWSNLAIAHANLGQHEDAARFYLSSLVLNPDATHIWNFLHSAVLNIPDGVNTSDMAAIDRRDLAAATQAFPGVLDPKMLPPRQEELPQPAEQILSSIGVLDL